MAGITGGSAAALAPAVDARFAVLTDPFGHRWMLNAPLPRKKAPPKRKPARKR